MIPYEQLSLADIYPDCQDKFENDKPKFLSLLESHIDIDEIMSMTKPLAEHIVNVNVIILVHLLPVEE